MRRRYLIPILLLAAALRYARAQGMELSEDPYHHWLIAAHIAEGLGYSDPLAGNTLGQWLPGYHYTASLLLAFAGTHALWALKAGNIILSLASILLVYLPAQRIAPGAGPWAAVFLALNPIDIATSSASYTEPMALVLILSALYLLSTGHRYGSPLIALVLLAAALTRYEAWLLVFFLALYPGAGLRDRKIVLLPAALFALGWSLYILAGPAALLAILAATSRSRLLPLALVSSFILLPYYLPLFDGLGSLYGPMARAGEFVGAQGAEGSILSDSPIPLYYSALPPERLLGPWSLPEEPGDALLTLDDWGVEYVIASGTPSRLTDLFPGLGRGEPVEDFLLVTSSGGWEVGYGGRSAHIYKYRRFGRYTALGATSLPLPSWQSWTGGPRYWRTGTHRPWFSRRAGMWVS